MPWGICNVSDSILSVSAVCSLVFCLLRPSCVYAESESSRPDYTLDEIVVVADRAEGVVQDATWATTILTREMLDQLAVYRLGDALNHIPGVFVTGYDGSDQRPVPVVRGFYGGGESDYLLLAIDGVPAQDLRTGLADWAEIPASRIKQIEVLRGGGSAAYGDAALGAVVNIVTQDGSSGKPFLAGVDFGPGNRLGGHTSYEGHSGHHRWYLGAVAGREDGSGGTIDAAYRAFTANYHRRSTNGTAWAILGSIRTLTEGSPLPVSPDGVTLSGFPGRDYREAFQGRWVVKHSSILKRADLSTQMGFGFFRQDRLRTLILTPSFSDTQLLVSDGIDTWVRSKLVVKGRRMSFTGGVDARYGRYESGYFRKDGPATRLSGDRGDRYEVGIHSQVARRLSGRWRAAVGARYDLIQNHGTSGARFDRLTPRAGLNFRYSEKEDRRGSFYLNWVHAFKSPTLDQLYDQREIPAGPGSTVSFSNSDLAPQTSRAGEIGIYQRIPVIRGHLSGEVSSSIFRSDQDDEIDFDLATYQYGNIVQSRHEGLEGSVGIWYRTFFRVQTTFNWLNVTFRTPDLRGNRLKNIPRTGAATVLTFYPARRWQATISHQFTGGVYLDDINRVDLPGHHEVGAVVSLTIGGTKLALRATNLTDTSRGIRGYTVYDPATDREVSIVFPTRERRFEGTVETSF